MASLRPRPWQRHQDSELPAMGLQDTLQLFRKWLINTAKKYLTKGNRRHLRRALCANCLTTRLASRRSHSMCLSASAPKLLLQPSMARPHRKEHMRNHPSLRALLQILPRTPLPRKDSPGAQRGKHTTSKHGQLLLLLASTHQSRRNPDDQQQCKGLGLNPHHMRSRLLVMSHPHRRLAVRKPKQSQLRSRHKHASLVCLPMKATKCLLMLRPSNSQLPRKNASHVCLPNRPTMNVLTQSSLLRGTARLLTPVRDAQLHHRSLSI